MINLKRVFVFIAAVLFGTTINAQTSYRDITTGTTISNGISLGFLSKTIPLPPGEWIVTNRIDGVIPLTGGRSNSAPKISLTLINSKPAENPIFALVVTFTPNSIRIRWGGNQCKSSDSESVVNDFGNDENALTYFCAKTYQVRDLKDRVATAKDSTRKWTKDNLTSLANRLDSIPNNALVVEIYGNQHLEKSFSYTFFMKREGDIFKNTAYARQVSDWVQESGYVFKKILLNENAEFTLPRISVTNLGQEAAPTTLDAASQIQKIIQITNGLTSTPVGVFTKSNGFAYQSDALFCDDLKWGINITSQIISLTASGKSFEDSTLELLGKKSENALRYETFGRIVQKLKPYADAASVGTQCGISLDFMK